VLWRYGEAVELTCCSRACNMLDRRARSTCSSHPVVDSSRRIVDRKHASPMQGRCAACTGRGWDVGSRCRPVSSRCLCTTVSDAMRRSRLLYRHTTGSQHIYQYITFGWLPTVQVSRTLTTGLLLRNHPQATHAFIRLLSLSRYSLFRFLVKNMSHSS